MKNLLEEEDEQEEEGCLCASGDLLFLACSGGSNVGQISNQAAVVRAGECKGRLFCLVGIGAHLDTMIVAAKERNFEYGDKVEPSELRITINEAEDMASKSNGYIKIIKKKR